MKFTNTYSECVTLLFRGNNGYANAPECYVLRSLLVYYHHLVFNITIIVIASRNHHAPTKVKLKLTVQITHFV
jgi:hypothetical protein